MDDIRLCNVLIQNNQFIFKIKDKSPFVLWFGGYTNSYYRPYYQYIDQAKRDEDSWLEIWKVISGYEVNVLISDDAIQIDFRRIKEFFLEVLRCRKVNIVYQSLYLTRQERYVALIKTCRCIIIKYIKKGRVIQENVLPISIDKDELQESIKELHSEIQLNETPIFIISHQEAGDEFKEMGTFITGYQILEHYESMTMEEEN